MATYYPGSATRVIACLERAETSVVFPRMCRFLLLRRNYLLLQQLSITILPRDSHTAPPTCARAVDARQSAAGLPCSPQQL
jgi:hypothetical protein